MTNTEALDLMLRLYITADSGSIALKQGHTPPPEAVVAFYRVVVKTMQGLIQKAIDDDKIPEWEIDQRFNDLLEELKQFHETVRAAKEVKH